MPERKDDIKYGQQYDVQSDIVNEFTEQVYNNELREESSVQGQARTEITPGGGRDSKVRVYSVPSAGALSAAATVLYDTITFDLPDTLVSVTAYYTAHSGDSSAQETGSGKSTGSTGALSINLTTSAQGSAVITGDLVIKRRPTRAIDVPCAVYLFYVPKSYTRAEIFSALSTLAGTAVSPWPRFKPEPTTVFIVGQQVDLSVRASLSQSATVTTDSSSASHSEGISGSRSVGVTLRSYDIPPTIHDVITIGNATTVTQNVTVQAQVTVTREGAGWLTADYWPARSVPTPAALHVGTAAASAVSETFGTTIPAVSGLKAIPITGLYARMQTQPWKFGYTIVRAEVVDFSYFA